MFSHEILSYKSGDVLTLNVSNIITGLFSREKNFIGMFGWLCYQNMKKTTLGLLLLNRSTSQDPLQATAVY